MEERVRPTRSGLVAIELVIAVGVFALCAAISMGLFVRSDIMSRESGDLTHAVSEARSAAECYKAAGGDLEETAALLNGSADAGALRLFYTEAWTPASYENATFSLTLTPDPDQDSGVREATLQVTDADGKEILVWTVAALEDKA